MKRTTQIMTIVGAGVLSLGLGACNNAPPEDTTTPVIPQKSAGGKPKGGDTPAPGFPATPKQADKSGDKMEGQKPGVKQAKGQQAKPKGGQAANKGGQSGSPATGQPTGVFANNPQTTGANPTSQTKMPARFILSGHLKDPFLVTWKRPVPPPYPFDYVEPIRVASEQVPTPSPKPIEIREQPQLRVSGIMNGEGVFAILEKADGVDIVKPGSEVKISAGGQTQRTYQVVSINNDTVKLQAKVGNVTYTQVVPLSDVPIGVQQTSFQGGRGGGNFGPPNGRPGLGGGLPGLGAPAPAGAAGGVK